MEPQLVYMQRLVQTWPKTEEKMTEKLPIIYNVKEEYLAAVFETVKKTYGSMEKFFQTVFYLKPKMIEEFRNKYLIQAVNLMFLQKLSQSYCSLVISREACCWERSEQ